MITDREYFLDRVARALSMSQSATNDAVAEVHLQFAAAYLARVVEPSRHSACDRPELIAVLPI